MIGTPTFIGGSTANVTTRAGWQLAPASVGFAKGSDGMNVGTNYYGVPQVLTPPTDSTIVPPKNLKIKSKLVK